MSPEKTEIQLAFELIKVLDGVSIERATNALNYAVRLLASTQIVSASSPLLLAKAETNLALQKTSPLRRPFDNGG